ncbi:MAG: peptidylprolyl isomerase [Bacteroidia bacterium]|nr:peptidylprolyl isomerase [Bacteroidia bacterium]
MRFGFVSIAAMALLFACQPGAGGDEAAEADVVLVTNRGEIGIRLFDDAPKHKANFLKLAGEGYYDSLMFHRIISGFMIQTGDPRGRGPGFNTDPGAPMDPGYTIEAEIPASRFNVRGAVAAARTDDYQNPDRRSSGSQFYIVTGEPVRPSRLDSLERYEFSSILRGKMYEQYQQAQGTGAYAGSFDEYLEEQNFRNFRYPPEVRQQYLEEGGAPWLDMQYSIFGEVVSGMDVVLAIQAAPVSRSVPVGADAPRILEVRIPGAAAP